MPVSIHLVNLEQLRSLKAGSTQVDGFRVVDGAKPEAHLITAAIEGAKAGQVLTWVSFFLIIDEARRHAIGFVNFHCKPVDGRVEVGYEVAPSFRMCGFATEAVRLAVCMALKQRDVTEVCAQSAVDNPASKRVLEKAGFRHVGQKVVTGHGLTDQWVCRRIPFAQH